MKKNVELYRLEDLDEACPGRQARNNGSMSVPPNGSVRWYRSFYWRIGLSFVILVVVVLVAQSAMFGYNVARSNMPFRGRSPNNLAAIVAPDIGSALFQQPALDLNDYLNREYGPAQPIYVVMKGDGVAANRSSPLANDLRITVEAVLAGVDFQRAG